MKVRNTLFAGLLLLGSTVGFGQTIPVEVLVSHKDYRYQHSFYKSLQASSSFGVFHTSSMYSWHDKEKAFEMMSQSYLTYQLHPSWSVFGGTFYASVPGFNASGGIRYQYAHKDFSFSFSPRLDIKSKGSYEVFLMTEYRPALTEQLRLYSRFQAMSNFRATTHNRGYQNVRLGLGAKNTVAGVSLNYDQYGAEWQKEWSLGVFLRYELGAASGENIK